MKQYKHTTVILKKTKKGLSSLSALFLCVCMCAYYKKVSQKAKSDYVNKTMNNICTIKISKPYCSVMYFLFK